MSLAMAGRFFSAEPPAKPRYAIVNIMTIKFKITLLSFCLLNERIGRYHISYFLNEIFKLAIINEKQGEN